MTSFRSTFTLPTGTKFRTQSSRRFVVVTEHVKGLAVIQYRTDDVSRAITRAAKIGLSAIVVDTVGGKARIPAKLNITTRERTEARWVEA